MAKWTCDEKPENKRRGMCRNPYGCHCAEIAALQRRKAQLERILKEAVAQEDSFGPLHPKWFGKATRALGATK